MSGHSDTAIGFTAMNSNSTGAANVAIGDRALYFNTTGSFNVAIGVNSLQSNASASDNTAIGAFTLQVNTGQENTAVGSSALSDNTAGIENTGVGWGALFNNTTGRSNTAIGLAALSHSTTGTGNIALGDGAGSQLTTGDLNIDIGNQGQPGESHTIRIGDPIVSPLRVFIAGVRGVITDNSDAIPVVIDSNGQLGTVSSSRRFKKDIENMGDATANLMRLRPVTYRYKQPFSDGSEPIQYGLIAEKVEEVYPELVAHSADGEIETVKYQVLDSMLLNELQKQEKKINEQESTIQLLESRLATLEQLLLKRSDTNLQSSAH